MKDGFVKVAVSTPELKVADCPYNVEQMIKKAEKLSGKENVKLLVFPEFSLTGYTCQDLFLQDALLSGALEALHRYVEKTRELALVSVVGMPLLHRGRLYNTAVVVNQGKILGIAPKTHLPNYGEFYEARQFAPGQPCMGQHDFPWGDTADMGTRLLFQAKGMPEFCFAIEICEDLWMPAPPSGEHAMAGATVIVNPSASDELTGKAKYRRELVKNQSARTLSAYLYADAGEGESTQDMVFAGHNLIIENGAILKESVPFADSKDLVTEIDLGRLVSERRRMISFPLFADRQRNIKLFLLISGKKRQPGLREHLKKHHLSRRIKRTATSAAMKYSISRRQGLSNV